MTTTPVAPLPHRVYTRPTLLFDKAYRDRGSFVTTASETQGVAASQVSPRGIHAWIKSPYRTLLKVGLGTLIAVEFVFFLADAVQYFTGRHGTFDFSWYYLWAWTFRLNPHASVYDPAVLRPIAAQVHFTYLTQMFPYPPPLPLLMLPLTWLPFRTAARVWLAVDFALWLASAALLVSWVRGATQGMLAAGGKVRLSLVSRFIAMITFFLVLAYSPLAQGVELGQASVLILFLLLLTAWLEQREHPVAAGAALALNVWIKPYPLLLVAYYAFTRQWRLLRGFAATFAAIVVALLFIVGPANLLAMRAVFFEGGGLTTSFDNTALARVPYWLALEAGAQPGSLATVLGYAMAAAVAAAFGGVMLLAWRHRGRGLPPGSDRSEGVLRNALGFAWALTTMILVSPITWEHYEAWLLPGFGLAFACSVLGVTGSPAGDARVMLRRALPLAAVVVSYALTMADLPFGYDGDAAFHLAPFVAGHPLRPPFMLIRPLGALLLWFVLARLYTRGLRSRSPFPTAITFSPAGEAPEILARRLAVVLVGLVLATGSVRWAWMFLQITLGMPHWPPVVPPIVWQHWIRLVG